MEERCFYCSDSFEDNFHHHGIFTYQNEQVDKALCPDCYQEWLEGIKE